MKSLKKYISILGIASFLFLIPVSVNIQKTTQKINSSQDKLVLLENKTTNNTSLEVQMELNVALAQSYFECSLFSVDITCGIGNFFHWLLISVGNILVGLSAAFLDFFLAHSIQSTSYSSSLFIKQGWEILRDMTNIIFIFALIYVAFKMVLGAGKNEKKMLIKTLLVALVINFSLFMSLAIIDTANIFAHVFFNKIEQTNKTVLETDNEDLGKIESKSPSLAIAAKINPQKLLLEENKGKNTGTKFLLVIMGGIINAALIYVFLSVAFLFLGRTVALMISSVLSPLAFASITIPSLANQKYIGFDNWLKSLIGAAFMAPVFIFILYLAVQFANISIGGQFEMGDFLNNIMNIIIPAAAILTIILLAKKVSTGMAGDFAGVIANYVSKGAMMVGGVALGGAMMTGGAVLGTATRLSGGIGKIVGKKGGKVHSWGERQSLRGKRMQSTKFMDISKIPGFNKFAPDGLKKASSYMAGKSLRGTENKTKIAGLAAREGLSNWWRGKSFEEGEHKYEQGKKKHTDEWDKRKDGGAATWQEDIQKSKVADKLDVAEKLDGVLNNHRDDLATLIKEKNNAIASGTLNNGYTDKNGNNVVGSGLTYDQEKKKVKTMEELLSVTKQGIAKRLADGYINQDEAKYEIENANKKFDDFKKTTFDGMLEQKEKGITAAKQSVANQEANNIESGAKGYEDLGGRKMAQKVRRGEIKTEKTKEDTA